MSQSVIARAAEILQAIVPLAKEHPRARGPAWDSWELSARQIVDLSQRPCLTGPALVVIAREGAAEVTPFERWDDAQTFYDTWSTQWTESYLCDVVAGPGRPLAAAQQPPVIAAWLAPVRKESNGEAGDVSLFCEGCDRDVAEPHPYSECAEYLRAMASDVEDGALERAIEFVGTAAMPALPDDEPHCGNCQRLAAWHEARLVFRIAQAAKELRENGRRVAELPGEEQEGRLRVLAGTILSEAAQVADMDRTLGNIHDRLGAGDPSGDEPPLLFPSPLWFRKLYEMLGLTGPSATPKKAMEAVGRLLDGAPAEQGTTGQVCHVETHSTEVACRPHPAKGASRSR